MTTETEVKLTKVEVEEVVVKEVLKDATEVTVGEVTEEITVEEVAGTIPSLPRDSHDIHETFTYHTDIPVLIANDMSCPCILGVDEAGRGPVLGPMVYAVSYCRADFKEELAAIGFDDSKVLTHDRRSQLLQQLCEDEKLSTNIGWATTIMTARDISRGMLKPVDHGIYNLNEQAHDTTMELIQQVLDKGVNITEAYIDTVGPPEKYQDKLSKRFPTVKFTVTKKADSLFPIVSAASICAKVTRDASLLSQDSSNGAWGSGYPSDPRTSKWLNEQVDPVFGWDPIVRFSWQTTRDVLDKRGGALIEWQDDHIQKRAKLQFIEGLSAPKKTEGDSLLTTRWFGSNVEIL